MSKLKSKAYEMLETVNCFVKNYRDHYHIEDLLDRTADIAPDAVDGIIEASLQKALLTIIKSELDENLSANQKFNDKTDWNWLNRLLTTARLKELASVKIIVKGRRTGMGYEIIELVRSHYGRNILKSLNFNVSQRRVVSKDEFKTIQDACAKIKLTLPEVIKPTTTECFFDEDLVN